MLVPLLYFHGDCEEAIAVYEKAINTKADTIIRDNGGGIVHAEMRIQAQRVMLNNRFGNKAQSTDCAVALVITFNNAEELRKCYENPKQDSVTIDPISKSPVTQLGVQFLDRFGVQWAFMVE